MFNKITVSMQPSLRITVMAGEELQPIPRLLPPCRSRLRVAATESQFDNH